MRWPPAPAWPRSAGRSWISSAAVGTWWPRVMSMPCTKEFLAAGSAGLGATVTLVDFTDPAAVEAAITPQTRALFCEPVSNPLLNVVDLPQIARLAEERGIPLVVDNTFLSPALRVQRSMGPLSSYTALPSTSPGTALSWVESSAARRPWCARCGDSSPPRWRHGRLCRLGPPARCQNLADARERHSANALALAELLAAHPAVAVVHYPGLSSHPGHAIASTLVVDISAGCCR